MEMTPKTKLIDKINNLFKEIDAIQVDLQNSLKQTTTDKQSVLTIGTKGETLRGLLNQFFNSIDILLTVLEGDLTELSGEVQTFYDQYTTLSKPLSEEDSPELKELKSQLMSMKYREN